MLKIENMAMFVVKSNHIQISGQVMDLSINYLLCTQTPVGKPWETTLKWSITLAWTHLSPFATLPTESLFKFNIYCEII